MRDGFRLCPIRSNSIGELLIPQTVTRDERDSQGEENGHFETVGYEHGSLSTFGGEGQRGGREGRGWEGDARCRAGRKALGWICRKRDRRCFRRRRRALLLSDGEEGQRRAAKERERDDVQIIADTIIFLV